MVSVMNTIFIADIKRGGMNALVAALDRGPVAIMECNRVAAVVLTPDAYVHLLAGAVPPSNTGCALDWLLGPPAANQSRLQGEAMTKRLLELNAGWAER